MKRTFLSQFFSFMMAKISSSEVLPAKSVSQAVNTNLKQLDHFIVSLMMVCSTFYLTHVKLSKDISFKAFNNLPGVTISNFKLPSDDPAGGIHIETDSLIPSPARV